MKLVVAVLLAFIMSQPLVVDINADLAQQAEGAYTKGNFRAAADSYQQLVEQGVKRSEVYFNLGNSYYQLHDLGHALVNYRRAGSLIPRDEDLQLNMARIRVQRLDGISTETGILESIAGVTRGWASASELGWIVIIIWWLCCGLIVAYMRRAQWRKRLRWAILVSCVLFIFVGGFALTCTNVDSIWKPAVIVNETVSVMSGPGADYVELYELHAAAEIRVVEERNQWVRFQLPDMREGWIEAGSLEII